MYKVIEETLKMTENEACLEYPDNYILMQMDSNELLDPMGTVLYIGDSFSELFALQVDLSVSLGVVLEGINISRRLSLGGLVVG